MQKKYTLLLMMLISSYSLLHSGENNVVENDISKKEAKRTTSSLIEALLHGLLRADKQGDKAMVFYTDYQDSNKRYTTSMQGADQTLRNIYLKVTCTLAACSSASDFIAKLSSAQSLQEKIELLQNMDEEKKYKLQEFRLYNFLEGSSVELNSTQENELQKLIQTEQCTQIEEYLCKLDNEEKERKNKLFTAMKNEDIETFNQIVQNRQSYAKPPTPLSKLPGEIISYAQQGYIHPLFIGN